MLAATAFAAYSALTCLGPPPGLPEPSPAAPTATTVLEQVRPWPAWKTSPGVITRHTDPPCWFLGRCVLMCLEEGPAAHTQPPTHPPIAPHPRPPRRRRRRSHSLSSPRPSWRPTPAKTTIWCCRCTPVPCTWLLCGCNWWWRAGWRSVWCI